MNATERLALRIVPGLDLSGCYAQIIPRLTQAQIQAFIEAAEAERWVHPYPYWVGEFFAHSDVVVASAEQVQVILEACGSDVWLSAMGSVYADMITPSLVRSIIRHGAQADNPSFWAHKILVSTLKPDSEVVNELVMCVEEDWEAAQVLTNSRRRFEGDYLEHLLSLIQGSTNAAQVLTWAAPEHLSGEWIDRLVPKLKPDGVVNLLATRASMVEKHIPYLVGLCKGDITAAPNLVLKAWDAVKSHVDESWMKAIPEPGVVAAIAGGRMTQEMFDMLVNNISQSWDAAYVLVHGPYARLQPKHIKKLKPLLSNNDLRWVSKESYFVKKNLEVWES